MGSKKLKMRLIQYVLSFTLLFVFSFSPTISAQSDDAVEETGYAGDHFSLEAALNLFKNAALACLRTFVHSKHVQSFRRGL